jgi:hypothetical protein
VSAVGVAAALNPQYPDAEGAEISQRTQKNFQERKKYLLVFVLRPLRNFCVLCVRKLVVDGLQPAADHDPATFIRFTRIEPTVLAP